MTLESIRTNIVKSFITQELLEQSIFPTLEKVCAIALSEFNNISANTSLLNESFHFKNNDPISRKKINELQKYINIDIETLYKFLTYIENYLNTSRNSILQKSKSIERAAVILENEANSLILLNEDSTYDINVIDESFENPENINTSNTDVNIDFDSKYAFGKYSNSADLQYINYDTVTVSVLSSGYLFFRTIPGNDYDNIANGSIYSWIQELIMPHSYGKEAEISIKIKLKNKQLISKIFINFNNPLQYGLKVTALTDGVYKTISSKQYYTKAADISFDPVDTDYLIFNMSLATANSITHVPVSGKSYKFSISELMIGKAEYEEVSVLETVSYNVGSEFKNIAIYSDEHIPDNCALDYSVSWNGTWYNLYPYNRDKIDSPISLGVLSDYDYLKSVETIDLSKVHPHIYGTSIFTSYTTNSIENLNVFDIKVLRNINGMFIDSVRNLGTVYIYAHINASNIDFSSCPGFLDNVSVSGLTDIDAGIHTFKFNLNNGIDNYKDFLDSISSTNLYYGSSLANYVDIEYFIDKTLDNDYSIFSFVNISNTYYAVVKMLNENVTTEYNYSTENMLFIYKDVVVNDLNSLPTTIKVKCTFTSAKYNTPILKGFKIKLG